MSTYDLLIEKGAFDKELQKNRDFVTSLIISTDFNDAKIATLVGVTIDYVKDLRLELKN